MKKILCFLCALIAAVIIGIMVCFISYIIAVTISPPITEDGHPVMPMGQAFIAMTISIPTGIVALFIFYKFFKRKFIQEE